MRCAALQLVAYRVTSSADCVLLLYLHRFTADALPRSLFLIPPFLSLPPPAGNEFSYQCLFTSHMILNATSGAGCFTVHPWVHEASNHVRHEDMVRGIAIPDVDPAGLLDANPESQLSMAAGDFVAVYSTPRNAGAWDAVLTCFFIDTAPVLHEYIDAISHMLRPGGLWINLGPLLYHWQNAVASAAPDAEGEGLVGGVDERYLRSVELPYADVRYAILASGFDIVSESVGRSSYAANPRGLMRNIYTLMQFTAVKRGDGGVGTVRMAAARAGADAGAGAAAVSAAAGAGGAPTTASSAGRAVAASAAAGGASGFAAPAAAAAARSDSDSDEGISAVAAVAAGKGGASKKKGKGKRR